MTMPLPHKHHDASIPNIFYVGGEYIRDEHGTHMTGQMCVRHYSCGQTTLRRPGVIFIHGAAQTGTHFEITPDGRPGMAPLQAAHGWDCYVVDQPGIGRSRYHSADMGPLSHYSVEELQSSFTAPSSVAWPQAKFHTQWPGSGRVGDLVFDAFYASQVGHISNYTKVEKLLRDVAKALLSKTGPAFLITHSQSGPLGWHIADECPDLVKGIVALEPHGPPFECPDFPPFNARPELVGKLIHPFGITSTPLQYSPALAHDAIKLEYEHETAQLQAEGLASGCRQKSPARQLVNLASIPIIVFTAEASYHATYDHLTVQFLRDAGVPAEHVYLAEKGIHGNGHMMAIESNNKEIQELINQWLLSKLLEKSSAASVVNGNRVVGISTDVHLDS